MRGNDFFGYGRSDQKTGLRISECFSRLHQSAEDRSSPDEAASTPVGQRTETSWMSASARKRRAAVGAPIVCDGLGRSDGDWWSRASSTRTKEWTRRATADSGAPEPLARRTSGLGMRRESTRPLPRRSHALLQRPSDSRRVEPALPADAHSSATDHPVSQRGASNVPGLRSVAVHCAVRSGRACCSAASTPARSKSWQ